MLKTSRILRSNITVYKDSIHVSDEDGHQLFDAYKVDDSTWESSSVDSKVITKSSYEEVLGHAKTIEAKYNKPKKSRSVDSPEFKAWFGNSKIVDQQGFPLVVYHGTPNGGFDTFKYAGDRDTGWTGQGFYFTHIKDIAKSFTSGGKDRGGRKQIYNVYLKAENPIHIKDMTPEWVAIALEKARSLTGRQPLSQERLTQELEEITREYPSGNQVAYARDMKKIADPGYLARIMGHDAILADFDGGSIMVFKPTQIKSATENKGAFNPQDPSIHS